MEHDAGTDEALHLVEDVAREGLAAGRAPIEVRHSDDHAGSLIHLVPTIPRACPVSVLADAPPHIEMFLGSEPTVVSYEFWRDDWNERTMLLAWPSVRE